MVDSQTKPVLIRWNPVILVLQAPHELMHLDDPLLREAMHRGYRVRRATQPEEALAVLKDQESSVAAVLVSSQIRKRKLLEYVSSAHDIRPAAGLYLWQNPGDPLPIDAHEARDLGFSAILIRGADLSATPFPWTDPLVQFTEAHQKIERTKEALPYTEISAGDLAHGNPLRCDLFVRLPTGRFVKLLHAGYAFPKERLEAYVSKGVTFFYIPKAQHHEWIRRCEERIETLQEQEEKLIASRPRGVEIAPQTIEALSYNREKLREAMQFVREVRQLVENLGLRHRERFGEFLNNPVLFTRGVETVLIAGALYPSLEIPLDRPASVIGLAALFHDIGLTRLPERLQSENEQGLAPQEVNLLRTHTMAGAEILREVPGIHPATIHAVAQHHFRKGGQGYLAAHTPSPHAISLLSELIAFSVALGDFLRELPADCKRAQMFEQVRQKLLPLFSANMNRIFAKSFLSRTSPAVISELAKHLP